MFIHLDYCWQHFSKCRKPAQGCLFSYRLHSIYMYCSGVPRGEGAGGGHDPRAQALEGALAQLVGANFKSRGEFQPSKSSICNAVADPGGGGGSRGSGPPLLCHDVGFLTLGPKLDPRLAPPFLLVDLIWTPPPPPLSKILDPPLQWAPPSLCIRGSFFSFSCRRPFFFCLSIFFPGGKC